MNSTIASLGRTLNSDADWSFHRNLFGFLKLLHCIGICGFRLVSFTDTPEVSQGFSMRLSENILGHCIFCLSVQISIGRSAFVEEKNKDYGKLSFWNILLFAFFFLHSCLLFIPPPPPCFHTATSTKFCPASSRPFFLVCTFVFLATSFSLYSRDWFIKAHGCVLNYCWIWTCQQLCTLFSSKNTCQKHVKLCIRGTYGAFIPYKCCSYVILEYIFF